MAALNDYIILIANGSDNKELVRTDGTIAGTESYYSLFPSGSEFFQDRNTFMTSDGVRAFFFYGVGTDVDQNVLFTTDGTEEGSSRLGQYDRITFTDSAEAPD